MIEAFYGDGTGKCFWCFEDATGEFMGVPLCDSHQNEEETKFLQDCGIC